MLSVAVLHGHCSAWAHAPDPIDPLGVQQPRVLSTSSSSKATSILGLFSCSPCVLLLQTAVSSSGISVEDYDSPRLETLFPFFSSIFLNLNQRTGLVALGAELG